MPVLPSLAGVAVRPHLENVKRAFNGTTYNGTSTSSLLSAQWSNPNDVLSVLLIIGGDIVREALAQTCGGYFTPVCFSFGWVAYSFTALVGIIGDGHLLPEPDYPVKVFNLKNGYARENKNWIIGRLLRDNEMRASKTHPLHGAALRISIYEAKECKDGPDIAGSGYVRLVGFLVMFIQLGIAAAPLALYGEWGVLLITASGTLLAQVAGWLPQWRAEKLPNKRKSYKSFALTSGNGARDIMIILGGGNGLDLEELSASETPRSTRLWDSLPYFSRVLKENGKLNRHSNGTVVRRAIVLGGIPLGFWVSIVVCTVQSMFWLALLITVAGLKTHTWYLLLVGAIGMFQNATIAAISRDPRYRNLPLMHLDTIVSRTVMDALMDLEVTHTNAGRYLRHEFFPGELRNNESEWWDGAWKEGIAEYDRDRKKDLNRRAMPRSLQPKYHNTVKTEKSSVTTGLPEISPGRALRVTQLRETVTAVNPAETRGTLPRARPLSGSSLDSEVSGPWKATPRSVPAPEVPSAADSGEVIGDMENAATYSSNRQDTGSSGTLSLDEMCRKYQLPDWVD
ncbi:uncharacterized protein PAC_09307 [Phialocephala subalpina]|uniref:Uncharacterized protein n=1 Tax=Phialocephala subalpina TaxID=576137 RepID=A0A1L7X2Z0_9HELO|nr:uncharacterized protein PAC_09307 [Phialocephala subalpina]